MKFLFNGFLFSLYGNTIHIWDRYGVLYRLQITNDLEFPLLLTKIKERNINEDHEQLKFERELRSL